MFARWLGMRFLDRAPQRMRVAAHPGKAGICDRVERYSLAPILDGLDAARRWSLDKAGRVARPLIRDRNRRVVAFALIAFGLAFAGTALAPGYMLLLGPVIVGVPHLFFEARYLFFQHEQLRRVALVGVLVAQTALVFAGIGIYTLGAATIAALAATGSLSSRKALAMTGLSALAILGAAVGPDWSRFLLLHLHNCVPLVVWLLWRKRPLAVSIAVAAVFFIGTVLIFGGALDAMSLRRPFGDNVFSLTKISDAVAAGFGGEWRHRFLLFFCFSQAAHYAIWLRLIPEEARERPTPRSWRMSWHAFKHEAGPSIARLMIIGSLAVPLVALIGGVVRTRALYVTASEFHATVEAILIVVVFVRRKPTQD
jgi:hypothetical protein